MKPNFGRKYFLTLLAAVAVIVISIVISQDVSTLKNDNEGKMPEVVSTITPVLIDEVNDGVYTNYIYGFRFEYPKDVFLKFTTHDNGLSSNLTTYPEVDMQTRKDALIAIYVYDSSRTAREDHIGWFNFMFTNSHETDPNGRKITSQDDFEEYKRVVYETDTSDLTYEKGYGYSAIYLKENSPVIQITLSTVSKETKSKYENIFKNIINSFQFI